MNRSAHHQFGTPLRPTDPQLKKRANPSDHVHEPGGLPFGYTRGSCLTEWASLKALMPDQRSLIEAVHVALFQEIDHMPEAVFTRNRLDQ